MNKRVSMKDIASALNMSVDGVSKALRDSSEISEATKEKVKEKAKELGYVKNSLAVSLKMGKTKNVAVFMNGFFNPYFAVLCDKIIRELEKQGYTGMVSVVTGFELKMEAIETVFSNNCSAVISLTEPNDDVVKALVDNDIPLFLIGIKPKNKAVNYIITDDYDGGKQVGHYFLNHGYRNCIYITDSPSETSTRRLYGFLDEIKKDANKQFFYVPFSLKEDIIDDACKMIVENNIEFAFCFSDYVALSLRVQLRLKYNIYNTIIFGFDDITKTLKIYEPINSVATNIDAIVEEVVTELNKGQQDKNYKKRLEKVYPVKLSIY